MSSRLAIFIVFCFLPFMGHAMHSGLDDDKNESRIYVLMGYPGAGKGTFAQSVKPQGYTHLSSGDILRDELKRGTEIGIKYKKEIEKGEFLPTEIVEQVVEKRIAKSISSKNGLILDGFPRTLEQAHHLSSFMRKQGLEDSIYYIYIEVDPDKALERIIARRTCNNCNRIYNLVTSPPQFENSCDDCKISLVHRNSDNLVDTKARIETYKKHLAPLVAHYKEQKNFITFDGNRLIHECVKNYVEFEQNKNEKQ